MMLRGARYPAGCGCRDRTQSHARLLMGEVGKTEKALLLEFAPDISTVHVFWYEGRVLHVQAAESAIKKRYDAYEGLPRVVIADP